MHNADDLENEVQDFKLNKEKHIIRLEHKNIKPITFWLNPKKVSSLNLETYNVGQTPTSKSSGEVEYYDCLKIIMENGKSHRLFFVGKDGERKYFDRAKAMLVAEDINSIINNIVSEKESQRTFVGDYYGGLHPVHTGITGSADNIPSINLKVNLEEK